MSLLFRRGGATTERRMLSAPWNSGGALSLDSTIASALRLIPLYSAVSLVSSSVATLPCRAYRNSGDAGRVPLSPQPMLITDPGVTRVNPVTWRQQAMVSMLLRGNAYGVIAGSSGNGWPQKVRWLNPDAVNVVEFDSAPPQYYYLGERIPDDMVVHVPGMTPPGSVVGLGPVSLFRVQIETGMRASEFGWHWFKNGVAPTGKLRNSEVTFSPEAADKIKARFREAVKDGDLFVTGKDWDYTALTVTPADAQFLESIKATATQIAAIFHVPPEDIGGEAGSSLTYATVEMNGIKLGQRAVLPWTARLEAAINGLLPAPQYVKFSLDALARTDLQGRMNAHATALAAGIETNDEARALEDRPPLTDEQKAQWQANYRRAQVPPQEGRPA